MQTRSSSKYIIDTDNVQTDTSDVEFLPVVEDPSDPSTAIAPGELVTLGSRDAIVFYIMSISASFLFWMLPALNTYLFTVYLHGSTQHVSQFMWLQWMAWSTRVAFAVVSDYVNIFGYRRKFWLVLGWIIAIASVGTMAFKDIGSPFCDPQKYPTCFNPKANTTLKAYDFVAPDRVAWYRTPTFFVHLGAAIVQASLDGVMVEYCHREPLSIRGRFQAFTNFIAGLGILYSRFFGLFGMSAPRYGGDYDYSAGPRVAYIIGFCLSAISLVLAVTLFKDTKNHIKSFSEWINKLWLLLQNRAVIQVLAFRFLFSLFQSASGIPVITWVTNVSLSWSNVT
ncbi:transmembrane protein, partial [Thraustotheca clavata]